MINSFILIALGLILFFHFFYLLAVLKKDYSLVDIAWGLGFILVASLSFFNQPYSLRSFLVLACISIWGIRLTAYIYLRNKKQGEDFRYSEMKKNWGKNPHLIAYFKVFWLQAILLFFVAIPIPIIILNSITAELNYWDFLGLGLWFIGLSIESLSDYQKSVFKRNPANKNLPLKRGLWRYSRHPNYFGEFLLWWGIYSMALNSQHPFLALVGPILITFLLIKVSGVPLLEEKYQKYPEYREYIENTNAFFPWIPKA